MQLYSVDDFEKVKKVYAVNSNYPVKSKGVVFNVVTYNVKSVDYVKFSKKCAVLQTNIKPKYPFKKQLNICGYFTSNDIGSIEFYDSINNINELAAKFLKRNPEYNPQMTKYFLKKYPELMV